MKRPLTFICISFILGILLGRYISKQEYIVFILMISSAFTFVGKKVLKTDLVFVMPVILLLGLFVFGIYNPVNENYGEEVQVEGWVNEVSYSKKGNQILDVEVVFIYHEDVTYETDYRVKVYMQEEEEFQVGNLVILDGYLNLPTVPKNDGGFDNYTYLNAKGFDYSFNSLGSELKGTKELNFMQELAEFRGELARIYDQILPLKEAAIVKAMILGDSSYIDEDLRELYADTGIAHVLAISGLHMGIISAILVWVFEKIFKVNKRKSGIIIVAILWLYALFVGFEASVVRSAIMISVMLLGRLFYRKSDGLTSLSLAALVILLVNPWQLWDVGFQLSFMSVLTLILISKFSGSDRKSTKDKIISMFVSGLVVSITTAPIVAWYFYKVPVFGCFANLLVIPIMGATVIFSMMSGAVGLVSVEVASFAGGGATYMILTFYEFVCKIFTSMPFSTFLVGKPSIISIILFYVFLITLYLKKFKVIYTYSSTIVIANLFAFAILSNRVLFKVDTVDFLDVGQGDCAVLRTYDQKTYIFDTGGYGYKELGVNTGKSIIIPYLQSHGISEVDGIFISHMDSDHALGAIELINEYSVKEVFVSDYVWEGEGIYNAILESARRTNTGMSEIGQGETLDLGGIRIECYYPKRTNVLEELDDNSGSLVLKLRIGEIDFLFTGDIGFEDEKELLSLGYDLSAEVLKISHHGSKNSSSYEFLNEVDMEFAVISRGLFNNYGHPSEEVLERLNNVGTKIYDTALDGQVSIKTNGQTVWIDTNKK